MAGPRPYGGSGRAGVPFGLQRPFPARTNTNPGEWADARSLPASAGAAAVANADQPLQAPGSPTALDVSAAAQAFTDALPSTAVRPFYRFDLAPAPVGGAGSVAVLTDYKVPGRTTLVITSLVFRAFDANVDPADGNLLMIGAGNPFIVAPTVGFQITSDGAANSPGQFGNKIVTADRPTYVTLNTNIGDALGWNGSMHYGLVIRSNGQLVTRAFQYGTFSVGATTVPGWYACEAGGFLADNAYVESYLKRQGRTGGRG